MLHEIKALPVNFQAVFRGDKTAEIRNNDRNYSVGDTIVLNEWDGEYTGAKIAITVTNIDDSTHTGIEYGYVMLSFVKNH